MNSVLVLEHLISFIFHVCFKWLKHVNGGWWLQLRSRQPEQTLLIINHFLID